MKDDVKALYESLKETRTTMYRTYKVIDGQVVKDPVPERQPIRTSPEFINGQAARRAAQRKAEIILIGQLREQYGHVFEGRNPAAYHFWTDEQVDLVRNLKVITRVVAEAFEFTTTAIQRVRTGGRPKRASRPSPLQDRES